MIDVFNWNSSIQTCRQFLKADLIPSQFIDKLDSLWGIVTPYYSHALISVVAFIAFILGFLFGPGVIWNYKQLQLKREEINLKKIEQISVYEESSMIFY